MLEDRMLRYRVMELHRELVGRGEFLEARMVLRLLQNKVIYLGLGDMDYSLEIKLEKLGCLVTYQGRHYTAHVHLRAARR